MAMVYLLKRYRRSDSDSDSNSYSVYVILAPVERVFDHAELALAARFVRRSAQVLRSAWAQRRRPSPKREHKLPLRSSRWTPRLPFAHGLPSPASLVSDEPLEGSCARRNLQEAQLARTGPHTRTFTANSRFDQAPKTETLSTGAR